MVITITTIDMIFKTIVTTIKTVVMTIKTILNTRNDMQKQLRLKQSFYETYCIYYVHGWLM
jgi:hypothetical protein